MRYIFAVLAVVILAAGLGLYAVTLPDPVPASPPAPLSDAQLDGTAC